VKSKPLTFKSVLSTTANFLAISILFAIAYAQSPLYTSNQNQYFLHGLAAAGFGTLGNDWLANTRDPTPVFSKLVEWTFRSTRQKEIFYAYYAILMGIYITSLTGLADRLYRIRTSLSKSLAFMAYASSWGKDWAATGRMSLKMGWLTSVCWGRSCNRAPSGCFWRFLSSFS
jgi:hypothetical protein